VIAVHGADGLDEITTTAATSITELRDGRMTTVNITPEDFGLARARDSDLTGGDVGENAGIVMDILSGSQGPRRDIVLINSAYALYAAEQVSNPHDGLVLAARLIDSGAALSKLEQLKEFTSRAC
jgi:anthranilate phosphoribosyltransferase